MAHARVPAVRYPVGSLWPEALVAAAGSLCVGVALLAWAAVRPDLPLAWWLMALLTAAGALWAGWRLRHPLQGEVAWDPIGEAGTWRWISAARPHGVALNPLRIALDLGDAVLLEGRTPDGLRLWLWCGQGAVSHTPARWLDLRRALMASAAAQGRSGIFERPAPRS